MYTYDDNTFSDLFKEVYGFRPRTDSWADWTSRTPRQKQELWNALSDELEVVMLREKLAKDRKTQNFENRIKETDFSSLLNKVDFNHIVGESMSTFIDSDELNRHPNTEECMLFVEHLLENYKEKIK